MSAIIVDFNPRSHERSDTLLATQLPTISISIHAPTRGATSVTAKATTMSLFQSTLPREERRYAPEPKRTVLADFNPRSHERSDKLTLSQSVCISSISIHAPTRGATNPEGFTATPYIFQSTLPREERPTEIQT